MATRSKTSNQNKALLTVFIVLIVLIVGYVAWESRLFGLFSGARLEAIISVQENNLSEEIPGGIMPGSQIKLRAKITNTGAKPSAPGKIFIRFAKHRTSEKSQVTPPFATEIVDLPAIDPDKSVDIAFSQRHAWPTPQDYIRQELQDYEYQAIADIEGIKRIIGTLPVGLNAYYKVGEAQEVPSSVPTLHKEQEGKATKQ